MSRINREEEIPLEMLPDEALTRVREGGRFAGLFAQARGPDTLLIAVFSKSGILDVLQSVVIAPRRHFPSLAELIPAATWYEREIADLYGLQPAGPEQLDPLILPGKKTSFPRPGSMIQPVQLELDLTAPTPQLRGEGVFTISYGPVRSGVFESVEYLVETSGEDIPHLGTRIFYKHRGVESSFDARSVDDGVLLAERCEGVASVAHAIAYCSAVEEICDVEITMPAKLTRVLHAELERVANHLDSVVRHTEAAGQAMAYARFSYHKENVQRLRARLCGSRFGRGVVVPGGVSQAPTLTRDELHREMSLLQRAIDDDTRLLMSTPSFLDRLRGTGVLTSSIAALYGALGPVGRASGQSEDVRRSRPYAAYGDLDLGDSVVRDEQDALARQRIRLDEISSSFALLHQVAANLHPHSESTAGEWSRALPRASGTAIGWAEAPQGELLTLVELRDGSLARVKPRSASFHNLALFSLAFPKDILTDFAFIEASFGLSIAGAAS